MMTAYELLVRQHEHVVWADDAGLAAAATAPVDRFGEDFGFSFGSVHATLGHMLGAQQVWLERLTRGGSPDYPPLAGMQTLAAVAGRWTTLHAEWRTFLRGMTEATLDRPLDVQRKDQHFASTVRIGVAHCLDHATHHRGQLNSLIKLAGGTPRDYGQMTWSRETGETTTL